MISRSFYGEVPNQYDTPRIYKESNQIASVARALKIIDYISSQKGEVSLTEISAAMGLYKSTALRILLTMETMGYVSRNKVSKKYYLGIHLVELAAHRLEQLEIRSQARFVLEELVQTIKETAHLAIFEQGKVVYIDKVEAPRNIIMKSHIGHRAYAHCTALGKSFLSTFSDEAIDRLISEKGLPRFTDNTIVDPVALREHLSRVKAKGYAIDDEENEAGVRCAAAVVFDYKHRVVGAISISGPSFRISRQDIEDIGLVVKNGAKRISDALGFISEGQSR